MGTRKVRVKFTEEQIKRLISGETLTINLPPEAGTLDLTMDRTRIEREKAAKDFANVGKSRFEIEFGEILHSYREGGKSPFDELFKK